MIWDLCLARRAAAVGGVAVLVAFIVVAATDAGGPWSLRLGMTSALAPLCGALGTLAAVRLAAAHGELRALEALGADPARAVLGAVLGGVAVGLLGAVVAGSSAADLGALFPRVVARTWVPDAGGMLDLSLGLRVGPDGALSLEAPRAAATALPSSTMAFTRVALAAAALACPSWLGAHASSMVRRAIVGFVALVLAIVAFQGVAAGLFPAPALALAPLVLLTDVAIARYLSASP